MWQNPYPWLRVRVFRRIEISVPVPVAKTRAKPAGTAVPVQFTIYNKVIFFLLLFLSAISALYELLIHCDDQTEPTAHSHSRLKGFLHSSHFKKQSKSHFFLYFN